MALAGVSKATLRTRLFQTYNEEEGGGGEFTPPAVNTCLQQAVHEFCLRTGFFVGSAQRARADTATGEALVTLPTGMFRVTDVDYQRHIAATTQRGRLRETTVQMLALREGSGWARHSDSTSGTGMQNHAWYRRGSKRIGLYPPNIAACLTVGTVIVQGPTIPDLMTATQICIVPEQFIPAVLYIGARIMAEMDADSDAEGARAKDFEAKAGPYIQAAMGYRPPVIGD